MGKGKAYLAGGIALLALAVTPASAQMVCKSRADILSRLAEAFQEAPVSRGLAANGTVLEVLASPDGATWTVLLTHPNGVSCMTANGEGWQDVKHSLPDTDPEL